MTLVQLINLFFEGNDDKVYIDLYEDSNVNIIFSNIRIISGLLREYCDRKIIGLFESERLSIIVSGADMRSEPYKALSVLERGKGEWIAQYHRYHSGSNYNVYKCTCCGYTKEYCIIAHKDNFCPNCGADMRGLKGEKTKDFPQAEDIAPATESFKKVLDSRLIRDEVMKKSCNTCKHNDDELSGECYECLKGIFDHYEAESEN